MERSTERENVGRAGGATRDVDSGSLHSLDCAIHELAEIEHRSGWGRVKRIAEVVARHFFGGETARFCSEERERSFSVRRLAAHPQCPLSKSQLQEVLSAYAVYAEDEFVRSNSSLTPSHVAAVAKVPSEERKSLLQRAVLEQMSVRELTNAARVVRRLQGERRGRPPTTDVQKAMTRLENSILSLEEGLQLLEQAEVDETERVPLVRLLDRAYELFRLAMDRAVRPQGPSVTRFPPSVDRSFERRVG